MISRHLQPRTCNDELSELVTWQSVIGQPPPCGRRREPHDTSLVTCRVATSKISLNTKGSDSDDEEDYGIQGNNFGAPVYGPKPSKYLNFHDPLDRSIALQEVLNPYRKICVWKKAVSFLGSLPVALQHEDWKPEYMRNHSKKEEGDEKWHAEIRLSDPYGNVYDQGFVTKKTGRRFSKYHKLSDIMSPNWFQE
ncbi:hypothetical protein Tco_0927888 [Tanacetum coccineum]